MTVRLDLLRSVDDVAPGSAPAATAEEGFSTMADELHGIQPVKRLRVSDSVAAELERLILRGDYEVGDKLPPERDLAERFGVGRSTMREALRTVQSEGLLQPSHGVGIFVASSTKRPAVGQPILVVDLDCTVPELFEVRTSLECDAAALAARRAAAADIDRMHEILEQAAHPGVSDAEFIRLDFLLHRSVAEAAKNKLLLRLTDSIGPLFVRYSEGVIALPDRREAAHAGHAAIVDAIGARNAAEARRAARRHLRSVEGDIVAHLELTT